MHHNGITHCSDCICYNRYTTPVLHNIGLDQQQARHHGWKQLQTDEQHTVSNIPQ